MTFEQTLISSAIGTFIGFVAALLVFFIKEWWQKSRQNYATKENLKLELSYNINLYEKYENEIQECIEALSNDSRSIYLSLDYEFVATYFAKQYYNSGLLLKNFHGEDMRRWNIMLNQVGTGAEKYVTDLVEEWRGNKEISKDALYKALKHEKKQVSYAKEMSEYVLQKL